jgi:hypothetical protein
MSAKGRREISGPFSFRSRNYLPCSKLEMAHSPNVDWYFTCNYNLERVNIYSEQKIDNLAEFLIVGIVGIDLALFLH